MSRCRGEILIHFHLKFPFKFSICGCWQGGSLKLHGATSNPFTIKMRLEARKKKSFSSRFFAFRTLPQWLMIQSVIKHTTVNFSYTSTLQAMWPIIKYNCCYMLTLNSQRLMKEASIIYVCVWVCVPMCQNKAGRDRREVTQQNKDINLAISRADKWEWNLFTPYYVNWGFDTGPDGSDKPRPVMLTFCSH